MKLFYNRFLLMFLFSIMLVMLGVSFVFSQNVNPFVSDASTGDNGYNQEISIQPSNEFISWFLDDTLSSGGMNPIWAFLLRIAFMFTVIAVMMSASSRIQWLKKNHMIVIAIIMGILGAFMLSPQNILSLYGLALLGIIIGLIMYGINMLVPLLGWLMAGIMKVVFLAALGILFWQWSTNPIFPVSVIHSMMGPAALWIFRGISIACFFGAFFALLKMSPVGPAMANKWKWANSIGLGRKHEAIGVLDRLGKLKMASRDIGNINDVNQLDAIESNASRVLNEIQQIRTRQQQDRIRGGLI